MSEYKKLSHTIWNCTYHIVFCPKYRFKIFSGTTEVLVRNQLYRLVGMKDNLQIEMVNVQIDHVHLILSIPPKYSVSEVMGYLKGKLAIHLMTQSDQVSKRYWGKHIWSRGYCVSTVGLNETQIKKYVAWQQERERRG